MTRSSYRVNQMPSKREAAAQLSEVMLPLYTEEIRKTYAGISAPPLSRSRALELIKLHPDHFADLIYRHTKSHTTTGTLVWEDPVTTHEFHDCDVEIVNRYLTAALYLQRRFEDMPHEIFFRRYHSFVQEKDALAQQEGAQQDQNLFFSLPPAFLSPGKWRHWRELETWTEDEAVAISFGRDPNIVFAEAIREETQKHNISSQFYTKYQMRTHQLKRGFGKKNSSSPLVPTEFMKWAKRAYDVVPLYFDESQNKSKSANDCATMSVEQMNPKSRKTLRLLILGMAIDKYGHNLEGNSMATSAIVNGLLLLGQKIDSGTVKDVLVDAAQDDALEDEVAQLRKALRSR